MLSIAKDHHIPIAVDCHTIGSLEDEFNQDYMQAADILFMSDEHIPLSRKEWMVAVMQRFAPKIFILGCGKDGSLMILRDDDTIYHTNAFAPRLILNTIGAGDALFSSFVHFYLLLENPLRQFNVLLCMRDIKLARDLHHKDYFLPKLLNNFFKLIIRRSKYANTCREAA